MRHHLEGSARYASEISPVPVINAGDGSNQHPTQTMLDLFTIYETQGTLENLTVTIVGDLKYGVRYTRLSRDFPTSILHSISWRRKSYISPTSTKRSATTNRSLQGIYGILPEAINSADILYMTRVQKERFTDLMEYEKVKNVYILHNRMLDDSKENLKVLHPLPRVKEIDQDVDESPKAYYFEQAKNGMYTRQAIICDLMGIVDNN
jgi:aspartate carbamoyltransferase catalytic subunit